MLDLKEIRERSARQDGVADSTVKQLIARIEELKGILKGHVIVAGETKAMQSALEKCLEVEAILPPATVRLVKDTLAMRQKALKALGIK